MHPSRRFSLVRHAALALAALGLLGLSVAPSAFAAEPPTVTVRVEGLTETKLLPTQVAQTGSTLVKDGIPAHACAGSSALAALDRASGGSWSGPWNEKFKQYEVFSIEGELHEFEPKSTANYFWSYWLNGKESEAGACEAPVQPGDQVLFFPSCFGEACPKPAPLPLGVEAPASANVGEPVTVTVRRFTQAGVASAVAGAAVVGGGAGAITNAQGKATLAVPQSGEAVLRVSAPESVRTEAMVCVHNGNDGTCGAPGPPPIVACPASVGGCPELPRVVVAPMTAAVGGVQAGKVYGSRRAPRVLSGSVEVPAGNTLREVRISLSRRAGKRCFVFNGARAAFVRARCGTARFFSVGASESFSYLLPRRLPGGRYVFQIEAVDGSGHATKLVPGVSTVVFRVA